MKYDCKMVEQTAQPAMTVRTRSSVQNLPQVLGETYGIIAQYITSSGEQIAGAPFVAYYNLDMQDLDIEIGIPVSKKLSDKDAIKASEIPAGKYATVLHIGPFSEMESTYNVLTEWVTKNGYEATGVAYELYINDPKETPIEELKTQILFLLK